MKKMILILFMFILFTPIFCFGNEKFNSIENNEQVAQENKIPWPPDLSNIEKGDPDEAYWMYVTRWIDSDDIPADIKKFANQNNCFEVMKSYHWSSQAYNYGNVYSCGKNKKLQYIIEKNGKIKFANWFLRKKLNITVYE